MSKSISAKIMSNLLLFWPKLSEQEAGQKLAETLETGEKPTPPPKNLVTRYEDSENGRVFISMRRASPYMSSFTSTGARTTMILSLLTGGLLKTS